MAKKSDTANLAVSALYDELMGMCSTTGYTPDAVFEGLLDYIIGYLNPSVVPVPVDGWKFKKEDNESFDRMMRITTDIYCQQIGRHGWYDPFGDLYMAIHAGGGGKGQFFTPVSVCEVMAEVTCGGWNESDGQQTPFGRRIVINDCAAGSGRLPLAGYCKMLDKMQREWGYSAAKAEARRPYMICEDLDFNCVKMSAINMAFHGCFGEAVCHNTLTEPDEVHLGYIVNETMYPFPTMVPSIRRERDKNRFVSVRHWQKMAASDSEREQHTGQQHAKINVILRKGVTAADAVKERKEVKQLTLW